MFKNFTPLHLVFVLLFATTVGVIGLIIFVKTIISDGMPSLYELENPTQKIATQIFSADGEILDHFYQEKRVPLTYNEIPKDFVNALVATEDKKFWKHWGVHTGRVFNSFIKNLLAGRTKEGASTITMQLARNLYLNRETSITRKVREAVTAFQIEKTYTKQEIIELYANTVNFGRGSYGLRIAANQYFNKEPNQLTTAECAFLVGLLKKPEYYNRRDNYDDAIRRRNLVLNIMHAQNFITQSNFIESTKEPISFMQTNVPSDMVAVQRRMQKMGIAPHFVETIRQQLERNFRLKENFNFYADGLTIYTTLDSRIQKAMNKVVNETLPDIQKTFLANYSWRRNQDVLNRLVDRTINNLQEYKEADPARKQSIKARLSKDQAFIDNVKNISTTIQIGIVVLDISTGAVVGMVGSSPKAMQENPDAKYSLNHAVQIKRQPGSAFKPFVYASALQKGLSPESRIDCGEYHYTLPTGETWSPRGSCKDGGTQTLTQAITVSVNTVAARLLMEVTNPNDVIALVQKAGVESQLDAVPALALGAGGDISPLEITSAFGIFGNNGIYVSPYFYDKIEDRHGEVILERKTNAAFSDVLEIEIAGQMTYMMQQVINSGTATRVKNFLKDVDAAGKTGTTNDAADAWFIGYTPQLVCGIWMGFSDKRVNFNCLGATGYGGRIAAPLWGAIMAEIYNIPNLPYRQKRFASFKTDTTETNDFTVTARPYSLTKTQLERINFEPANNSINNNSNQNEEDNSEDDATRRNTFLPDDAALLFDSRKRSRMAIDYS